jgi:single-stranded-DNA-specific exonuclease
LAGLAGDLGMPVDKYYKAYLDLATLGTIADVVPLLDENRVIAKFGLERIPHSRKPGVQALDRLVRKEGRKSCAQDVSFGMAPRINAVGRLEDSRLALELMICQDRDRADELAQRLDEVNKVRQEKQNVAVAQAVCTVENEGMQNDAVLVVEGTEWPAGLVGLVAGNLGERYYRPAFVVGCDPVSGKARGSARSCIESFNVYYALKRCEDLLLTFGGHNQAGGFSLPSEHVPEVRRRLIEFAKETVPEEDYLRRVEIDAEVDAADIKIADAEALSEWEPCGAQNPQPVFMTRNMKIAAFRKLKDREEWAKLTLVSPDDKSVEALTWSDGVRVHQCSIGEMVDIAYRVILNKFNGRTTVEWCLADMRPSEG